MESTGALITVVSGLVVIPLSVLTFYLRSTREQHAATLAELSRRVESAEQTCAELRRMVLDFDRDHPTKEEWLRESMLARQGIERLRDTSVRMEARMDGFFRGAELTSAGVSRSADGRQTRIGEDQR